MKITSVTLPAFKSFASPDPISMDAPRVYVCGIHGVGKTTLGREAIRWILTGKAQGLDGKGSGGERLIPNLNGSTAVSAALSIAGIGAIERTWTPTGSTLKVQGFTGTSSDQQAALYAKLQTSEALIHACLDSKHFVSLHHADAKAMVLDLLDVRITFDKTAGEEAIETTSYTLAELDEVYKHAFEDRKVAKKRLQSFVVPPAPVEPSMVDLTAIDKRLAELGAEIEAIVGRVGSVSGQRSALASRRLMLSGATAFVADSGWTHRQVDARIEELEERLGLMTDHAAPRTAWDALETPTGTDDQIVTVPFLKGRLDVLETHRPSSGCVIDPEVECATAMKAFRGQAKIIKKRLESVPHLETGAPVTDPRAPLQQELATLRVTQAAYVKSETQEAQRVENLLAVDAELSSLPDTSEAEAKLADCRSRISRGQAVRKEADAYWKAADAHQKGLDAAHVLRAEVDRLEQLCDVLGPSGARVLALQQKVGDVESRINAFTGPFGWTVSFVLDPWNVRVNDRDLETYSTSEQYLIGIAVQLAVASLSGLKFAVIDELNVLLDGPRNVLQQLLWTAPLDQLFILSSREPGKALPPVVPGLMSLRLGKGDHGSVVVERQ